MNTNKPSQSKSQIYKWNFKTDIPIWWIIALAAISIPRVVVHDLRLVAFDSLVYTLLAVAPFLLYLAIAIFRKNKRPFYDFVVLGLFFGLFLAITHQITWTESWGDNPPHIGGSLEGTLSPALESLILRFFTFTSSIMTGLGVGVVFGLVATLAARLRRQGKTS